MLSLQAITVQNILENLAINDETSPIIEKFITNYLNNNPNYLEKNNLYHVYFRQRDPFIFTHDTRDNSQLDMELLKTFFSKDEAIKWIIENGKIIVEEQEENYADDAIVLTIIHSDNKGTYPMGEGPNRFSAISFNKHESFAFSRKGYLMLLREHIFCVKNGFYPNTDPDWVHFYVHPHLCLNSVSLIELMNINEDYTLDDYNKRILNKILKFYFQD